jgi:hypothetical protein
MALNNPLKTNLAPLVQTATTVAALAGLVMVTPQGTQGFQPLPKPLPNGQLPPFPPSILFQYEGEQIFTAESDITDHYIEDNTAIQDQIALKPEMYKTHGYIGELSDVLPPALQIIQQAANALIGVSGYLPQLSITAYTAYLQALLIYESVNSIALSAVSAYSSLGGSLISNSPLVQSLQDEIGSFTVGTGFQNKQQVAMQQFYGYWFQRTLFDIQTPWCILTDMAILDMRAIQDEKTRMVTDFEITFKKIRIAESSTGDITSGIANNQSSPNVNNGISSPSSPFSFGSSIGPLQPAGL